MAAWPHKNSPAEIGFRQRMLRCLPTWDPDCEPALDRPEGEWAAAFGPVMECLTGHVSLPVGVVGPVSLELGQYELDATGCPEEVGRLHDDVFVPLAHTEGGLSLSMQRGARAVQRSGGVRTHVLADRITRDSCFVFETTAEALELARWVDGHAEEMRAWLRDPANPLRADREGWDDSAVPGGDCAATVADDGAVGGARERSTRRRAAAISAHAELREVQTFVMGPMCHVFYRFTTGDACGPNMMTRNAHALNRRFILERFQRQTGRSPQRILLEANMGGDKKPSFQYFHEGHGKTVMAEVTLADEVVRRVLHVTAEDLNALQVIGLHGSHASGMQSAAFTPASAVAAIFAATGQDLGMVGTSSMAHTAVALVNGGVHVALRLPGLEVGTVGGGTGLPHARAWLRVLGCDGPGRVYRFAQVIAAAVLCLELSASASMAGEASENFYRAHLERGGLRVVDNAGRGGGGT